MNRNVIPRPAAKPGGVRKGKKDSASASSIKPRPGFERVFERVYRLVLKIPIGRVMTYGQIARLLQDRYSPRLVGWAMHAVPHDNRNIPWHRVINSRGGISTGKVHTTEPDLQRWMLEAEGVSFDDRGFCDLSEYQWSPGTRRKRGRAPAGKRKRTGPGQRKGKG